MGVIVGLASGCGADKRAGDLHARQAVLEREVKGLRESVDKLERGEPLFPEEAVVVALAESVVQEVVSAQLPFAVELESYKVDLTHVQASFKGSPSVSLTGSIALKDHPDYVGEVRATGALDAIEVEAGSGILRARVAVDHVDLLKMGGLEKVLGGGTLDELGHRVRNQLVGKIPEIQIPVRIEQAIELPALTEGPVRLQGISMPLAVSVADVRAGQGVLWIAINVVPGEVSESGGAGGAKDGSKPSDASAGPAKTSPSPPSTPAAPAPKGARP
jgi:hypothetical protein